MKQNIGTYVLVVQFQDSDFFKMVNINMNLDFSQNEEFMPFITHFRSESAFKIVFKQIIIKRKPEQKKSVFHGGFRIRRGGI